MVEFKSSMAVLVVEDNPVILMDVVWFIEDAGFMTYAASDADEAIRLLEQHRNIRVLFTDIDMPGSMDGARLAHFVRKRWPPVKIILTSGHLSLDRLDVPADSLFFAKPHRPTQITETLRSLGGWV
jgi:CheY-like chemotaxis protein